jgi:hypothetical protein
VQPGDHDGIVSAERRHHQFAVQESWACQVLSDLLRVLADLGERAQDFGEIDGADRRARNTSSAMSAPASSLR